MYREVKVIIFSQYLAAFNIKISSWVLLKIKTLFYLLWDKPHFKPGKYLFEAWVNDKHCGSGMFEVTPD